MPVPATRFLYGGNCPDEEDWYEKKEFHLQEHLKVNSLNLKMASKGDVVLSLRN